MSPSPIYREQCAFARLRRRPTRFGQLFTTIFLIDLRPLVFHKSSSRFNTLNTVIIYFQHKRAALEVQLITLHISPLWNAGTYHVPSPKPNVQPPRILARQAAGNKRRARIHDPPFVAKDMSKLHTRRDHNDPRQSICKPM